MAQTIRQGDVYVIPATIPADVSAIPRDNGRVILAYGEVTGHAHAIATPTATLLRTETDERFLRIVGSGATVTHEEHAAIEIAPGEYRVVIGREFTADMAAERVLD